MPAMSGHSAQKIELGLDLGASALLASAVAFAAARVAAPVSVLVGATAVALGTCLAALRRVVPDDPGFTIAEFVVEAPVFEEIDELILTDADRLSPAVTGDQAANGELLLDDVLAELNGDSRVVRLFDRAAMPTPGQLQRRIDEHLSGAAAPAIRDASEALHEALAELRRSLS